MEKTEKLPFGEWCENMWYHYKWLIIFGGLFVIFIVISVVQLVSTKDPDADVLFVGPWYMSAQNLDEFETTLKGFSEDYNGDGKVKVNTLDLTIEKLLVSESGESETTVVNYDERNTTLQRFQTEIRTGDAVIYFLDPEYFEICRSEGILCPIADIIDDADMPSTVIDGCGIPLSALDAYELNGISRMPEDTIVCIRRSPENDAITYGRTKATWDGNRRTFIALVRYSSASEN